MTEEQAAAWMGEAIKAYTDVMRAALNAALRWQVEHRGMPTEQAQQIVLSTGAALQAALKGIHGKLEADQKKAQPAATETDESLGHLANTIYDPRK